MIETLVGEIWKEFATEHKLRNRYAISNFGRVQSFTTEIGDRKLLKQSLVEGYPTFRYKVFTDGKVLNKTILSRKLVAENFLPAKTAEQTFVLNLDYNKQNNRVTNLRWVTKTEMTEHMKRNPGFIATQKKLIEANKHKGGKLSSAQVMFLKKRMADPNRKTRLKMYAKQFGVTTMQLYRIKTGENWAHIKTMEELKNEKTKEKNAEQG